MGSHARVTVLITSPKAATGEQTATLPPLSPSPKGMCVCSPTTHEGSFRCRFHRSKSSPWKRSNSMPSRKGGSSTSSSASSVASLSPRSVESP